MSGPARRAVHRALAAVAAVALVAVVLGVSLHALLAPGYTAAMVRATGGPARSRLGDGAALDAAEAVRAFVAGSSEVPPPPAAGGRAGFDPAAVGHLRDVREVIAGGRVATGASAALLALFTAWCLVTRRPRLLGRVLIVGGLTAITLSALAAIVGVAGFDSLFTWFHGLFFAPGTWLFSEDSLLIQLFPLPFWSWSAAVWAALTAAGGLLSAIGGRVLLAENRGS